MLRRWALASTLTAVLGGCAGDVGAGDGEFDESDDTARTPDAEDERDATADGSSMRPARDAGTASRNDAGTAGADGSRPDAARDDESSEPTGASVSKTLRVRGNRIVDTCGEPWVARGVEQLAGKAFSASGTLMGLATELIATGSNAVRILPQVAEIKSGDLDQLLAEFAKKQVVIYISPGDRSWFKRADVKEVLLRHEKGLILDAFQEPDYDDVPRWIKDAKGAIAELRSAGYAAPLTVLSNQYGRDLPAALEHGAEIVAADPMKNTIVGWQAYWGKSGWYQRDSGMSLEQGVERCSKQSFAMQVGIDLYADQNDPMDYVSVMAAAQQHSIGWLWWNFWNQWDSLGNNASLDGTMAKLTPAGKTFLLEDPNSIARTSKKACFR